jgi:hypothetical protein
MVNGQLETQGITLEGTGRPTWRLPKPVRWGWNLLTGGWRLARAHDLNPWVFIGMSLAGYLIHSMVYMPWFQGQEWQLSFLILLRVLALVVPAYVLIKGKGIARAFNASVVLMFAANTTWHVCYYVYW